MFLLRTGASYPRIFVKYSSINILSVLFCFRLGDKMALEIKRTISLYCGSQEVYMWSLFYQNFLAQCD